MNAYVQLVGTILASPALSVIVVTFMREYVATRKAREALLLPTEVLRVANSPASM